MGEKIMLVSVIKRDGRTVPYDGVKIIRAIEKALAATGEGGFDEAARLTASV